MKDKIIQVNRAGTVITYLADVFCQPFLNDIEACVQLEPTKELLDQALPLTRKTLFELIPNHKHKYVKFNLSGKDDILSLIRKLDPKDKNNDWLSKRDQVFERMLTFSDAIDELSLRDFCKRIAATSPTDSQTAETVNDAYEKFIEAKQAISESNKVRKEETKIQSNISAQIASSGQIFGKIGQVQEFIRRQPLFFDRNKLWWAYNKKSFCYERIDETDILNALRNDGRDTIDNKSRSEYLAALQQVGRENVPEELPIEWVQIGKELINPKTGERMTASPEYFCTNPIPHELGNSESTPNIDRLVKDWMVKVGVQDETYVQTFHELAAYCITPHKFMQRLFANTGSGRNGKSISTKLITKLVGDRNVCATDLKDLINDKWQRSITYRKLVCFAGEASYSDLSNTNAIKKIRGEDMFIFEFKGKDPFAGPTTITFIMNTNALPETPDQSDGFYRSWLIIDWPNQFEIRHDLLDCITQEEMNNWCTKLIRILGDLYRAKKFTNEGSYEERRLRYEAKSRPLEKFIAECCEENPGTLMPQQQFARAFNEYLKRKSLRQMTIREVGKQLSNHGYTTGVRKINDASALCVLNLTLLPSEEKTNKTNKTNESQNQIVNKELSEKNVSNVSFVSFSPGIQAHVDFAQTLKNSGYFKKAYAESIALFQFNLRLAWKESFDKGAITAHANQFTLADETLLLFSHSSQTEGGDSPLAGGFSPEKTTYD